MSKRKTSTVRIINPALGGAGFTSRKAAEQYVSRGRAVFDEDGAALRFVDQRCNRSGQDGGIYQPVRGCSGGMTQLLWIRAIPARSTGKDWTWPDASAESRQK
jgi:hypothetical protein